VTKLFESVQISLEYVPEAMTALERHSQNNILFDPKKARNISDNALTDCEDIFEWFGLPFTTKTPLEDFESIFMDH